MPLVSPLLRKASQAPRLLRSGEKLLRKKEWNVGRKRSHSIWVGRESFLTRLSAEKMAGRQRHLSMTSSVSILVPGERKAVRLAMIDRHLRYPSIYPFYMSARSGLGGLVLNQLMIGEGAR